VDIGDVWMNLPDSSASVSAALASCSLCPAATAVSFASSQLAERILTEVRLLHFQHSEDLSVERFVPVARYGGRFVEEHLLSSVQYDVPAGFACLDSGGWVVQYE
jgi:hypothetical protein